MSLVTSTTGLSGGSGLSVLSGLAAGGGLTLLLSTASSGATALLAGETQGLALDFTDDYFAATTGFYGSARIIDTGTPANNYNTSPTTTAASLLTYTSPSLKMTMGPSGTLRFQAHNFVTHTANGAGWTAVRTTVSTTNGVADPLGGTSAFTITAGGAASRIVHTVTVPRADATGLAYVYKIWVRRRTGTGAVNFENPNVGVGALLTLTSSWQQITGPADSIGTTTYYIGFRLATSGDEIDVYAPHIRMNPSDSTFLATTTAARYALPLEWSTAGVLQGLLVEEARTNLVTYSDDLSNAAWFKAATTAAKTATGPDGVANSASTVTATASPGAIWIRPTSASAARITSLYIKRRTGSGGVYLAKQSASATQITGFDGTFATSTGWTAGAGVTISGGVASFSAVTGFNLNTGSILTAGKSYVVTFTVSNYSAGTIAARCGSQGAGTGRTANGTYTEAMTCQQTGVFYFLGTGFTGDLDDVTIYEADETTLTVTSEWTRVSEASHTSTNPLISIRLATSGDEVDVALVQHEVGAFVTSPIPTVGASASRNADDIRLATSLFPFSATTGTLFAQFAREAVAGVLAGQVVSISDGSASEYYRLETGNAGTLNLYAADGGVIQTLATTANAITSGATSKAAGSYEANNFAWGLNGGTVVTDTSGTLPTVTEMRFGRTQSAVSGAFMLQKLLYLPRTSTGAQIITLTDPSPTITSASSVWVAEDSVLAHALTADETVTWSIVGGADRAQFAISGSTLQWVGNGVQDFDAPADSDDDNDYIVRVRATDSNGYTSDQVITVYVEPASGAADLLLGETQGLALDFTDSFYQSTTGFYGSGRIIDLLTSANNYSTSLTTTAASLLTYTSPSLKMTRGPGGASSVLRFQAHNLCLQSATFDNASWTKTSSTVSADATAAPTGAVTADKVIPAAATAFHQVSQAFTVVSGASYEASVYVKAAEKGFAYLTLTMGVSDMAVLVDLSNGTYAGYYTGGADPAGLYSITSAGSGWYKVALTRTATNTSASMAVGVRNSTGNFAAGDLGDGSSGAYAWGAHFRRTPSDSTYLATTTAARYALPLEWSTAGVLQGLLVEEARTNLLTYSEDFTNAAWTEGADTATMLAPSVTGPDGRTSGTLLVDDGAGVANLVVVYRSATVSTATAYTYSCYMKANGNTWGTLRTSGFTTPADGASYFDLGNGVVGTAAAGHTTRIQSAGNGWYRCSITFTTDAADTGGFLWIGVADADGDETVALDGTSSIYIFGAQLEAGAFPTSYIPTIGATATRAVDNISLATSAFPGASWPVSMFGEVTLTSGAANKGIMALQTTGLIEISMDSSSRGAMFASGTAQASGSVVGAVSSGATTKVAARFNTNDARVARDGSLGTNDTAVDEPAARSSLRLGFEAGGAFLTGGYLRKVMVVPRAMTDGQLQTLTT